MGMHTIFSNRINHEKGFQIMTCFNETWTFIYNSNMTNLQSRLFSEKYDVSQDKNVFCIQAIGMAETCKSNLQLP